MRANKAPFSFGIEARVPFLDKEFLQLAMNINPREKMVCCCCFFGGGVVWGMCFGGGCVAWLLVCLHCAYGVHVGLCCIMCATGVYRNTYNTCAHTWFVPTTPPHHRHTLQINMNERPDGKHPRMEKYILRKAFDDPANPYLPDNVLFRQKEQFSDGVGYDWVDGLKQYAEEMVSEAEWAARATRYGGVRVMDLFFGGVVLLCDAYIVYV